MSTSAIAPDDVARIGKRVVRLINTSITELPKHVDALVSSDDNYLSHGGGVSNALWTAAGQSVQVEVESARPRLKLGDVFPTTAGSLNAKHLLHAITIDFDANIRIGNGDPVSLFRKIFAVAEELGCKSVALPLVGSGAAGLSIEEAFSAFTRALSLWLQSPSSLFDVTLVLGWTAAEPLRASLVSSLEGIVTPEKLGEELSLTPLSPVISAWLSTTGIPLLHRASVALRLLDGLYAFVGSFNPDPKQVSSVQAVDRLIPPLDTHQRGYVLEARFVRNRLAHSFQAPAPEDTDALNRGIYLLLRWIATNCTPEMQALAASQFVSSVVEPGTKHNTQKRALSTLNIPSKLELTPSAAPPKATVPETAHPTAPLRQLHAFLLEHLAPESLSAMDKMLEQQGYCGTAELRLLEHLVRIEDPVRFIASEFSRVQLQVALKSKFGIQRPGDSFDLAKELLNAMGFPVPGKVKGLRSALDAAKRAQQDLILPNPDLDGIVTSVAKHVEFVCHVLLRFVSQAAFSDAAEIVLKKLGKLQGKSDLKGCTLGTLLDCVSALTGAVRNDVDTPAVQIFRSSIKTDDPFPDTNSLAALRNSFAHFKVDAANRCSTESLTDAKKFVDAANGFLSYLEDAASLFPRIVTIEEIHIDRWGRRVIVGITDEGQREGIFTDQTLDPGKVYFMHPLTNPLRVDPILVAAGSLMWLERN